MLRKERASLLLCRLDEHYPEPPIPLDHSDPFSLLIAVLLSAQCTDKKVNEVTPALFAAGPTPSAMAALTEAEIFEHIRQLGLAKTKARNVRLRLTAPVYCCYRLRMTHQRPKARTAAAA